MAGIILEQLKEALTGERPFEIAERKGIGHPDFICDAVMEEASSTLAGAYLESLGEVPHFNLDKCFLAAGRTTPLLGGGTIHEPMRLIFGDRATYKHKGKDIPVAEIVQQAARNWIQRNLRFVEPDKHVVFQNEIRSGSPELAGIFGPGPLRSNDTAAGVGFAPLSETEELVIEAERYLNSSAFKKRFPESGEDVKVLGVRRARSLALTVAMALVDRFLPSERAYFVKKLEIEVELEDHLKTRLKALDGVSVYLNTLDQQRRKGSAMYLTVTGTSAEGADSGQLGRGNLLSGVFSVTRPASNEAPAGKNQFCHIGSIYNVLARRIAHDAAAVPGVREATIYLVGQIGAPVAQPHLCAAQLVLARRVELDDVRRSIEEAFEKRLAAESEFLERRSTLGPTAVV
jgi:S-adenosylmethionine synthetase